jgi:hypothetical protein
VNRPTSISSLQCGHFMTQLLGEAGVIGLPAALRRDEADHPGWCITLPVRGRYVRYVRPVRRGKSCHFVALHLACISWKSLATRWRSVLLISLLYMT